MQPPGRKQNVLVEINKTHYLATCITGSLLVQNWGKSLDNQNVLQGTKLSLLVAPGATRQK